MGVEIAPGCFDVDAPVDPDGDELDDAAADAAYPEGATGHYEDGWEAEPRFRVVTDTVELAAQALLVAAERFMNVGESGTEHGDGDDFDDEEDRTPSSTHVSVDDDAAYVSANTSEWLSHAMVEKLKYILIQELTVAGVSALIEADYNPIRGIGADRWSAV